MSSIANDLELYERHADEWWDERSAIFRSLRATKLHQIELLVELIDANFGGRVGRIVDLGCGGGFLAVPLAARADSVVGVDLSGASLLQARGAAQREHANCRFVRGDAVRAPLAEGCADIVVLSDVVEHVPDPAAAVLGAARLLKPGGLLYVNTLNSTRRARFLAVTFAERVGLVPRGTHDASMFVSPEQLGHYARAGDLELVHLHGAVPLIWRTLRTWTIHLRRSRSTAVTYDAVFRKRGRSSTRTSSGLRQAR